jgi:hypothetical protein
VYTNIKQNGAVKGFSFQEKQELRALTEIENYAPKKVNILKKLLFNREELLKMVDYVQKYLFQN